MKKVNMRIILMGLIFAGIFWIWQILWQILMAYSLIGGLAEVSNEPRSSAGDMGVSLGVAFLFFVWCAGSVVFGLLMFLTRGEKILITRDSSEIPAEPTFREGKHHWQTSHPKS